MKSAERPIVTRFCDLVAVRHPIVQTGMGWVAGPRLVVASAEAGALGILASATMSLEELRAAIREVRSRTTEPFGVNFRADAADVDARVALIIEEGVQVASVVGAPAGRLVDRLKEGGVVVMPTVAQRRHAEKVAALGVDALIAQGSEGGGHTGSVPTSLLVPDVVDAVGGEVVVLAAGGMHDGRSLAAALAWGADGIAMGTRFLLTKESTVPDEVKARYLSTGLSGTVVSRAVDGAPQRVIATGYVERLEASGSLARLFRALASARAFRRDSGLSLPGIVREGLAMKRGSELSFAQVLMAANAPMMTKAALVDGRLDAGVLPTGQVVGRIEDLESVSDLVGEVVSGARAVLDRMQSL